MNQLLRALAWTAFCFPIASYASEVRIGAMGGSAGLDDEGYIFAYPSLVTKHSFITAQLGDPAIGEAHLALAAQTSAGSFGVGLNRSVSLFTHRNPLTNTTDVVDFGTGFAARFSFAKKVYSTLNIAPQRPVDLLYGFDLSGAGLGFRVTGASFIETLNGPAHDLRSARQFDAHVGYHTEINSSARLDLALMLGVVGKVEIENDVTTGTARELTFDRGFTPRLLVRYLDLSTDNIRPYGKLGIQFQTPEAEKKQANVTTKEKGKETSADLQLGLNYSSNPNFQLSGGLAGLYVLSEGPYQISAPAGFTLAQAVRRGIEDVIVEFGKKTKRTHTAILSNVGAEAFLTTSWGLLAGFEYVIWGEVETKNPFEVGEPKFKTNTAPTSNADLWKLGVFYSENEIRVDAAMAIEDLLHNGPHFITGNATPGFVGQIAATYSF